MHNNYKEEGEQFIAMVRLLQERSDEQACKYQQIMNTLDKELAVILPATLPIDVLDEIKVIKKRLKFWTASATSCKEYLGEEGKGKP